MATTDPSASPPRAPGGGSHEGLRKAGRATVRGGAAAGRGAARGGARGASYVASKLITASAPRGARESGLTALIWNQVLSFGADAMITVALAGTVFFGASADAQRGNVLEYLLVTMAPFALVAPVIGPAMDRLQHGRRFAMAGTAVGRAVLALVMATHFTNLLVLFPCALGSLVLSKAYSVVRAAAAPRLVPAGMTLVEANSRLSVFALGASLVGGGFIGAVIKLSGSYQAGLVITALAFGACAYYALRLPRQVDAVAAPRVPRAARVPRAERGPRPAWTTRLVAWAGRGFSDALTVAMQATCGLRFLTGFLTLYLAFHVQSTAHGARAAVELGAVVVGAGVGNFLGNVLGARLRPARPERLVFAAAGLAAVTVLVGAVLFSPVTAVVVILLASTFAALAKIALDSLVQRDVVEMFRASAFGRSESFLQLSWVIGGTVALLLPSGTGWLGFTVAGVVLAGVVVAVGVTARARARDVTGPSRPVGGRVA